MYANEGNVVVEPCLVSLRSIGDRQLLTGLVRVNWVRSRTVDRSVYHRSVSPAEDLQFREAIADRIGQEFLIG